MNVNELIQKAGALQAAGQTQQTIELYREWLEKHGEEKQSAAIYFNQGMLLKQSDPAATVQAYQNALKRNPLIYQAAVNLGLLLESQGKHDDALDAWKSAWHNALPDEGKCMLLNHEGRLHEKLKHYPQAENALERSLKINPTQADAVQHFIGLRRRQCRWPSIPRWLELARKKDDVQLDAGPFMALSEIAEPARQRMAAERFIARKSNSNSQALPPAPDFKHDKLRIGYLSGDFKHHAVSILMAEVFELHNRERVQIYGLDYSETHPTAMRQRVLNAFDYHIPLHSLSDQQAAERIRALEIDIIIDLTGLTAGSRFGILAYRAAPMQVSYLGYMGSSAIPGMDYILADRFLMPPDLAAHFTEKPLYLKSYQANDRKRFIGNAPTRENCGLPKKAFVFCAFNNNYKFTPDMWARWMRILKRTQGSVLWVLEDNAQARENLTAKAKKHGIDADRLIFASRVAPEDYLARYHCADLFLDTTPYGAGTTASDALWVGLPVLTCPNQSMISRMAGSLLIAAGLPELITDTLEAYEDLAVELATKPRKLNAIRKKLHAQRDTCALFNTPDFVTDLENVLIEHYQAMPKNVGEVAEVVQNQVENKADNEKGRWSSYQSHYNRILAPWRNQAISMLEIGEKNARSLEEWARYFVNAQKIVGCDINPLLEKTNYDDPRIHTVVGNINHPDIYQKIYTICPQFDLIVDAGSHKSVDILLSFAIYFRFLKPGGVYIVEDTYTQYDENYGGGLLNEKSVYGFFKRLIDVLNYQFWEESGIQITTLLQTYLPSDKLPKFIQEGWIDGIEFRNSLIIIHKAHEVGHQKLGQKLSTTQPHTLKKIPLLDNVIAKVTLSNNVQGIKKDVAVVVFIPGYPRSSMIMSYMEVADTLIWGFKQLGFNVKKSINQIDPNCTNVIIGFQIPAKIGGTVLGLMRYWSADTIVYNLEQYAEHEGFKNTIGEYVVNKFQVWDYSQRNLKKWQEVAQNRPPLYVPISYAPILEKIPHKTEDIDLFFYGKLSAERLDFVNQLTAQNHLQRSYVWGKNIWGTIRDEMIGRSKLVLNLTGHESKNTIFEIVRVSYLLANGRAVICQKRENLEIEQDILESGLLFLDESNFNQQVQELLTNDEQRLAYAQKCKAAFCQRDIRQTLIKALNL